MTALYFDVLKPADRVAVKPHAAPIFHAIQYLLGKQTRTRGLGVKHFGQTGSLAELYRHYGIDTNAIVAAAQAIAPGRPIRHLKALP